MHSTTSCELVTDGELFCRVKAYCLFSNRHLKLQQKSNFLCEDLAGGISGVLVVVVVGAGEERPRLSELKDSMCVSAEKK